MNPIQAADHAILAFLTRRWSRDHIESYVRGLRVDDEESAIPNVVGRTFQVIDAKAAALLTHTSMMVAALGVSTTVVAETAGQQAVVIAEMLSYLVISLMCLRCISLFHEPPEYDDETLSAAARDELILRRGLYRVCNRLTIYLTVLVLFSLPILFVL